MDKGAQKRVHPGAGCLSVGSDEARELKIVYLPSCQLDLTNGMMGPPIFQTLGLPSVSDESSGGRHER